MTSPIYSAMMPNYAEQSNTATPQTAPHKSNATQKFLDYMSKTPEERYYETLLAQRGLTKEQLEALPVEERIKIEEEIKNEIEKRTQAKIEEKTGIMTS